MKKWWIVYNDASPFQEYFQIVDFISKTFSLENIPYLKVPASILKNNLKHFLMSAPIIPDCVLFWDKSWEIAKYLTTLGISVYNPPDSALICENKFETYKLLQNHGLIPQTFLATIKEAQSSENSIIAELGFPMVAKLEKSVLGNNVFIIKNIAELKCFLHSKRPNERIAFQKYLSFMPNIEIKILSTKTKVLSSFKRTLQSNGTYSCEPYLLSTMEEKMSKQCCNILGLTFAGIDMLFTDSNHTLISDVNTQPNLLNIFKILGINAINEILQICN